MCSIFSGSILANLLLGQPIIGAFKNKDDVLLATLVWYFMFYSPFDICFKLCNFTPIKVIIASMKEIIRVKKVHDGVVQAADAYPDGYLIMAIIGTIKGNGAAFLKIVERILRGKWTPDAVEVLNLTFTTKTCILASILFIINKKSNLLPINHAFVHLDIVIFFVYYKLYSLLIGTEDPFVPIEKLFCHLFFGGIWDEKEQISKLRVVVILFLTKFHFISGKEKTKVKSNRSGDLLKKKKGKN